MKDYPEELYQLHMGFEKTSENVLAIKEYLIRKTCHFRKHLFFLSNSSHRSDFLS